MFKWIKRGVLAAVLATAGGFLFFGTDVFSYVTSSGRLIKDAVRDSVPVEFELKRARDLLEELIPEMRANLTLVAQEEVEVHHLEKDLQRERESVRVERERIAQLRNRLNTQQASYTLGHVTYSRAELVEKLSHRFDRFRTAERLLAGKEKLLQSRRAALEAGIHKLEKTRLTRLELETQIEALEGEFRLMQAQAANGNFALDDSKLAQTQRLLTNVRKRLEVAQRVLARESRFIDLPETRPVDESAVLEQVDNHLNRDDGQDETVGSAGRSF